MIRPPRAPRLASVSSVYSNSSQQTSSGSVFGQGPACPTSPRSPPNSAGGFFDGASGFGGVSEDPYAYALKAVFLAYLFDSATPVRRSDKAASIMSSRPSILGGPSKLKRAKLPKDYAAALIEQLVGDLKATSKQQGIEAKQWNATVSSFLVLLEEKKSLKKERNWSELLAAFTQCAVSTLPSFAPPTAFIERFSLISSNASKAILSPLDKDEKDTLDRLEAEMLVSVSPVAEPGSKVKPKKGAIQEWTKEEEAATKDLARVFSAEGRIRKDWAKLRVELDEKNYHNDLNILIAQTSAEPPSVHRSKALRKLDDLLSKLLEHFPHLTPLPPVPLNTLAPPPSSPSMSSIQSPRSLFAQNRQLSYQSIKSNNSSNGGSPSRHYTLASERSPVPSVTMPQSPGAITPLLSGVPAGVTFVPSNSRSLMRELVDVCAGREKQRSEGVETMLRKCGDAWMVTPLSRKAMALEVAVERWEITQDDWEQPEGVRLALQALLELGDLRNADEEETRHLDHHLTTLLATLLSSLSTHLSLLSAHSQNLPKHPNYLTSLLPSLVALLPPRHPQLCEARDNLRAMATESYVVHATALPLASDGSLTIPSFELLTDWVEKTIIDLESRYPVGELGMGWEPAGIALEKMLPLLFAEMSGLERVDARTGSEGLIFGLYERAGRLVIMWKRLCPDQTLDFDIDGFFEPHVLAWLESTDEIEASSWVSRAVTADEWKPEGKYRCSSSVIDLFEFIRSSVKVVLVELPLSRYPRAAYIVDLSKSSTNAIAQYASTLEALFDRDLYPASSTSTDAPPVNPKSASWFSKMLGGAKPSVGFMIPVKACVKINDIAVARSSASDLLETMEPQETAELIHRHTLGRTSSNPVNSNTYTVSIIRAEDLYSKSKSGKPACGFVAVHEGEERLIKTKTVLDQCAPRWEQGFETSGSGVKTLELSAMDRQPIGKHDVIGKATFVLNPRSFTEVRSQDLWLPLIPRGRVLVRIGMVGDLHDVGFYFMRAARRLLNAERDMSRKMVEKLLVYARTILCRPIVRDLSKSLAKNKKLPGRQLRDADIEIEHALLPLTIYLDANFLTFSQTFTNDIKNGVIVALWRGLVSCLLDVLCPPLAVQSSTVDPLSPEETDIVFKWLKLLRNFFNATEDGVEHGIPLGQLQSGTYRALILCSQNMDLPTDPLKENATLAVKAAARRLAWQNPNQTSTARPLGRSTSRRSSGSSGLSNGSGQRGNRGEEGSEDRDEELTAEVLLRILMTRAGTSDFIAHNIQLLNRAREQVAN